MLSSFAQYVTETTNSSSSVGPLMIAYVAVVVLVVASMWKIFTKAGQPGWAAIVPIYNAMVELQIVKRPTWWLLLLLLPFVNFIVSIILMIDLAKAFGKDTGYALGLIFLPFIFLPMLAFGKATYTQPVRA